MWPASTWKATTSGFGAGPLHFVLLPQHMVGDLRVQLAVWNECQRHPPRRAMPHRTRCRQSPPDRHCEEGPTHGSGRRSTFDRRSTGRSPTTLGTSAVARAHPSGDSGQGGGAVRSSSRGAGSQAGGQAAGSEGARGQSDAGAGSGSHRRPRSARGCRCTCPRGAGVAHWLARVGRVRAA